MGGVSAVCLTAFLLAIGAGSFPASAASNAPAAFPWSDPVNATVDHGILRLSNGTTREVGNTTSALQGVMDTVFARPVLPNATALAWFNSSVFSTLTVRGTYKADVTLRLASFFILDLDNAIISAASSVTGAVVSMNATRFAVVRGGTVTCAEWNGNRTATQVIGIEAINAPYTLLDSVTVTSCGIGNTANIHIRGEPFFSFAEIRNVTCVASEGRGIWTETCTHVVISGCDCYQNFADGIDLDAYTSSAVVFNNTSHDNRRHGIFVEEAASSCVVTSNRCTNNTAGIALYDNQAGPSTANVIVGNTLLNNRIGFTFGALQKAPKDAIDNLFVANVVAGNTIGLSVNGNAQGNYISANRNADGLTARLVDAADHVVILDPFDAERETD